MPFQFGECRSKLDISISVERFPLAFSPNISWLPEPLSYPLIASPQLEHTHPHARTLRRTQSPTSICPSKVTSQPWKPHPASHSTALCSVKRLLTHQAGRNPPPNERSALLKEPSGDGPPHLLAESPKRHQNDVQTDVLKIVNIMPACETCFVYYSGGCSYL